MRSALIKNSPWLEECIRSLKRQSVPSEIILCTSTPSKYIQAMAEIFGLPLYVRDGESDIQADWNFAYSKAKTRLVTVAHQDDCYHKNYGKYVQECWEQYPDTTVFTTDCGILRNSGSGESGDGSVCEAFAAGAAAVPWSGRQNLDKASAPDSGESYYLPVLYV